VGIEVDVEVDVEVHVVVEGGTTAVEVEDGISVIAR
jgi:hypothetical protein